MRYTVLCLMLMFFSTESAAQNGYPNTCDPTLGTGDDCFALGNLYGRGNAAPFPIDSKRSELLLLIDNAHQAKTCQAGQAHNCLGWYTNLMMAPNPALSPERKSQSLSTLKETLERLCLAGTPLACLQRTYFPEKQGEWFAKVKPTAQAKFATLSTQCDAGKATACGIAGVLLVETLTRKHKIDGGQFALLKRSCLEVDENCDLFGQILRGFTRGPDDSKAKAASGIQLLDTACEDGQANACAALYRATSVRSPKKQALLDKACDAKHADSCAERAQKSYNQFNTKEPLNTDLLQNATDDFTLACKLRHQVACHTLEHLSGN